VGLPHVGEPGKAAGVGRAANFSMRATMRSSPWSMASSRSRLEADEVEVQQAAHGSARAQPAAPRSAGACAAGSRGAKWASTSAAISSTGREPSTSISGTPNSRACRR
jgi:hypothetical protein